MLRIALVAVVITCLLPSVAAAGLESGSPSPLKGDIGLMPIDPGGGTACYSNQDGERVTVDGVTYECVCTRWPAQPPCQVSCQVWQQPRAEGVVSAGLVARRSE